jgi:hypothetical protein
VNIQREMKNKHGGGDNDELEIEEDLFGDEDDLEDDDYDPEGEEEEDDEDETS